MGRLFARSQGQVYVELALVLPIFTVLVFGCLQFALIFNTYLSVMNVTRDYTRWLVTHPHTTDAAARAQLDTRLPNQVSAANLTTTVTPSCSALVSGQCSGRTLGTQLTVTASYDITGLLFLPSTFNLAGQVIAIPSTLPAYSLTMLVEPTS